MNRFGLNSHCCKITGIFGVFVLFRLFRILKMVFFSTIFLAISVSTSTILSLEPVAAIKPMNGDEDVEEILVVDSGIANYDGKTITLKGNVVLEHQLGKISADHVILVPVKEGKKLRFKTLTLKDNVNFALKDGGELSCACALLDYDALQGTFTGQEYVVYRENRKGKGSGDVPIVFQSRQMKVNISKPLNGTNTSAASCLNEILADNQVTVTYNNDLTVAADHAAYKRFNEKDNLVGQGQKQGVSSLAGIIYLQPKEINGICKLSSRNEDQIEASRISIDTEKKRFLFSQPKGIIRSKRAGTSVAEKIEFSSDTLTWQEEPDILTLRDHVVVNQTGIGQLVTDKELHFFRHTLEGVKRLRSIESPGPLVMSYRDETRDIEHTLTCYGSFLVDHQNLKTVMESPRDLSGQVLPNKQVFFSDNLGEIYADRLVVDYQLTEGGIEPLKLRLEGHVRILNRCGGEVGEHNVDLDSPFRQYALADIVEYTAHAKELNLSSLRKGRVLFLDKMNNLQVSAPALKIRRDQTTKKDSIQGVGDVRFNFVEKEMDQFKKLLPATEKAN